MKRGRSLCLSLRSLFLSLLIFFFVPHNYDYVISHGRLAGALLKAQRCGAIWENGNVWALRTAGLCEEAFVCVEGDVETCLFIPLNIYIYMMHSTVFFPPDISCFHFSFRFWCYKCTVFTLQSFPLNPCQSLSITPSCQPILLLFCVASPLL